MSQTIKEQLPIAIYPRDDEEVSIEKFTSECPECKEKLNEYQLRGTVGHTDITTAKIDLDCYCVHCGYKISKHLRIEAAKNGMLYILTFTGGKWNRARYA